MRRGALRMGARGIDWANARRIVLALGECAAYRVSGGDGAMRDNGHRWRKADGGHRLIREAGRQGGRAAGQRLGRLE